jgi:hypothetical protein
MTTDELERVLHDSLLAVDGPVELLGARTRLAQQVTLRRTRRVAQQPRLAVAAVVVVVVLSAALAIPLLTGRDRSGPPVADTQQQLAPSGLPVGILTGTLDPTPVGRQGATSLRLVVRADGSGEYRAWDPSSGGDASSAQAYEVALTKVGTGRAELLYDDAACPQRSQLILDFTLAAGRVRISRAQTPDCLVSGDLAARLAGSALRVRALTAERPTSREVSPSGLPVGLLKAFVEAGTPPEDRVVLLVVHADGTGAFDQGLSNQNPDGKFGVDIRATARGRVTVRYESPAPGVCADGVAFAFTFTEKTSSVLVDQAQPGCLLPGYLASAMKGLVLERLPLVGT